MPANIQQLAGFKLETQRRVWSVTPSYQVFTQIHGLVSPIRYCSDPKKGLVSYSFLLDVVSTRRRVWSDTLSWVLFQPGERGTVNYSVLSRIVFTRRMFWSITPSYQVYFYLEKGLVSYSVLSVLFLSGEGFSQLLRPIRFINIRRRV